MADSAVRFLLLSTTLWTLLQAPEIQAQTTSVLTITRSPLSVSPYASSSLATPSAQTSAFSSNLNSTIGLTSASSIAAHSSSFLTNTLSTHSQISSVAISTQSSASETIAPAASKTQQTTSSTPASPSQSVTSSPPTKGEDKKETFTLTEYILVACLGSFVFVLIAIIVLVVQIKRLSKSVRNLKATSNR